MNECKPPPQAIVRNLNDLLGQLGAETVAGMRLIAIDGVGGAGKSALGTQIAVAYDTPVHVDLDKFLNKEQGIFVDALRLNELNAALDVPGRTVIATGVCMLRVLEAVNLRADVLIYVKRMCRWGWADEDEVADDFELTIVPPAGSIRAEVRNYHIKYRPHERAEIVFERMDNS